MTPPSSNLDAVDVDWGAARDALEADGATLIGRVLDPTTCAELRALFDDDTRFRKSIDMARHRFGSGLYKYFAAPLPEPIDALRRSAYAALAPLANAWAMRLGQNHRYPETLDGFLTRCSDAGQTKPTPLLLRYRAGDYNRLHQDLYGDLAFPLQVVVQLSKLGDDFTGGEFVVVENRARTQSRAHVFAPDQGEAVVFAGSKRPTPSARGWSTAVLRHGVSTVRSGERMTLGLIFHNAA